MKQRWKETKKKEYSKAAKSNQFPRFEDKHLTLLPAIGCPTLALQTKFYLLVFCKCFFYVGVRPLRKLYYALTVKSVFTDFSLYSGFSAQFINLLKVYNLTSL